MGKILTHMTMSLDGYIADPNDQVGELFEWYNAGEIVMPTPNKDVTFKLDQASAEMLGDLIDNAGAMVSGKHLFDITNGWGDKHPMGVPVVVVTHHPPAEAAQQWPTTSFVNGVKSAVDRARQIAGDKDVVIASANVIQQALDLGLVDEVCLSLAPVLFGEGIPYFSKLARGHQMLEDPVVVQGRRAVHLRYAVRR
jgi:dihydrofolate reductase